MAPSTTSKRAAEVSVPVDTSHLPLKSGCMASTRNLKRESERLRSFKRWTVDFLNPRDLAANGFYYTNTYDVVKCAFCGVEIGYWEKGDDLRRDHVKWSRDCDFINGRECGNVPADESEAVEDDEDDEDPNAYDTCGPFRNEIRPFSGPERGPREINAKALWKDLEHLGVSKTTAPVTPRYSTYESRLKTFEAWPADHGLRPEVLAEAGFYYLQYHDNTMCFHCGGGLKNWEADDDPWVEHARWFNMCGFINIQKGKEFVNEVLSKKQAIMPAEAVMELRNTEPSPGGSSQNLSPAEEVTEKPPASSCSSSLSSSSTREIELCRICYQRERAIVFLPCGHFVSCVKCAPSLVKCAVCRKPYEATVRAYLS